MEKYLAHIKFQGEQIENGYLDARKSAEILIGIDEIIRYSLFQEDKKFSEFNFDIPIRVEKGSWMALLPSDFTQWIITALGAGLTTYTATALKNIAKNDFKNVTSKDIGKKVIKGIKWSIEIVKHIKDKTIKTFSKVDIKNDIGIIFIGIKNQNDEMLYVPKEYLEFYSKLPLKLLEKLTKNIDYGRELEIDFSEYLKGDSDDTPNPATISNQQKRLFYEEPEDNDETLFPELKHNQYVELEGHLTRGNDRTNTLGFEYSGHILTCKPASGHITQQKNILFSNCIIKGYIDRIDKDGTFKAKRPIIKYVDIVNKSDNLPSIFD